MEASTVHPKVVYPSYGRLQEMMENGLAPSKPCVLLDLFKGSWTYGFTHNDKRYLLAGGTQKPEASYELKLRGILPLATIMLMADFDDDDEPEFLSNETYHSLWPAGF